MPPRSIPVGVKDVFLLSLLLPIVGALQQHSHHNAYLPKAQLDELSEHPAAAPYTWTSSAGDSLDAAVSKPQAHPDAHSKSNTKRPNGSYNDERALATVSPAENNPAVRALPVPLPASSAGLSSRHPARSLQDWQVEDIVLLATVDGNIHAHDRQTGARKWDLGITDRPMVETIYHARNKSIDENGDELKDPLWIVEPHQDGNIYLYDPSSGSGIQKLPFTVRELVDSSPIAGEGQLAVVYTAEKKTTLYTIDAASGRMLKFFPSVRSMVNDGLSCKIFDLSDTLEDEACKRIGNLTLGRTEYTINVEDGKTGEPISTIKYSEWVPNNRDQDLRIQHRTAMDGKYVYSYHDGSIFGLDLSSTTGYGPRYKRKLSAPVARVFDILRRQGDVSTDASLVVLPQPERPHLKSQKDSTDELYERIFVDCTATGSWYALSESNYPSVTDSAALASWPGHGSSKLPFPTWPNLSEREREELIGVHQLVRPTSRPLDEPLLVDAPVDHPRLDPPVVDSPTNRNEPGQSPWDIIPSLRSMVTVICVLLTCGVLYRSQVLSSEKKIALLSGVEGLEKEQSKTTVSEEIADEQVPMLRESEPAKETIFPHEENGDLGGRDSPEDEKEQAEDEFEKMEHNETAEAEELKDTDEPKPKKKATRGKRGGKKQKEKEQQQAEARARRANSQGHSTEIISVAASESPQIAGPLQINSLLVHTDKVIGQGSCGTCVFEGSFEGRDVAVKRMLSQYYELASQEVSFLQQSDDHPNVVRYFCQQRDDHFLYIAVELCQASVFEVWEAEKAKTDSRQIQLRSLKHAIQQNVPKALHQLAAGLYHLHNLRIIHRDIKPQNILVAYPKRNQNNGPRLVISDFGLGKNLPENVSTLVDPTGNAGTSGWKAPELISQPKESESRHSQSNSYNGGSDNANGTTSGVKRAADIFSLGCLFFWVLTDGAHPYEDENGWQQLRELNIKRDNKKMGVLERWSDAYEPMQLITSMLEHQPENRPTALQVLNHPFFWSPEKRLSFLCDCSDHFEREQRGVVDNGYQDDSWHLYLLECKVEEVIGAPFGRADFLSKLDRHFVDTLGKQRKYSGNRLLDLLRALRNKKNHYEDMPEDVKRRVGPLAGGYLNYWSTRFPRLLMACYEVVHEARLQSNDRFKGYFAMEKP